MQAQLQGRAAARRLLQAGLSNYYGSRADYAKYRGAAQLQEYVSQASHTLHVVSYWMAHGVEMENIGERLVELIQRRPRLMIAVSVISPEASFLPLLATHLGIDLHDVVERIQASLRILTRARESLPPEERHRFAVKTSSLLPIASYVMVDVDTPGGRVQVDIKPYKLPRQSSVTFEFQGTDNHLYRTFRGAALRSLAESDEYVSPGTLDPPTEQTPRS